MIPQPTADGSFTFFSPEFGEAFHSHSGAKQEAQKKFVESCEIPHKAKTQNSLQILDVCYGLGYNTAAALASIWSVNPDCKIELVALELDPLIPRQAIAHQLLKDWDRPIPQLLTELASTFKVERPQLQAQLLIGDARQSIQQVRKYNFQADAIFLDPFSPPKCPQLWTVEFLKLLAECLKPTGRIATYSCAASVRSALILTGLKIGSTPCVGRRSPGTVASFIDSELPTLSLSEQEHLYTRAAIPYRDPHLQDSTHTIWQRRQTEQQASLLEPTSHWKKRWSISSL
jgi:tRNA U34 5-methylaminomethyl-2-thiouridine-forming methyltransferase MnmC